MTFYCVKQGGLLPSENRLWACFNFKFFLHTNYLIEIMKKICMLNWYLAIFIVTVLLYSLITKMFIKSVNQMIRPLWNVNKGTDSSTSLGWSLTNVGKSYSSLFPNDLHFTKSYILQEAIVNTFQTGMAMINYIFVFIWIKKTKIKLATALSLHPQHGRTMQF